MTAGSVRSTVLARMVSGVFSGLVELGWRRVLLLRRDCGGSNFLPGTTRVRGGLPRKGQVVSMVCSDQLGVENLD